MRIRLFLLVACLAMLLSISGAALAQATLKATTIVPSNVRSGPGTDWRIQGVAQTGTTVLLDGQAFTGNWVRGITSAGLQGWMFTDNLNISQDQAAGLRQIWVDEPFNISPPAQEGGIGGSNVAFSVNTAVRLRSGPGTQWRILKTLEIGQALNVDGKDFSGTWVRGIDAAGEIGWVFGEYVTGNRAALPTVNRDTPFGAAPPPGGTTETEPPPSEDTPPIVNTAPVRGFQYGGHVRNFNESTVGWMRTAGMTWVKKQLRYTGQDPSAAAGMINSAHANGFRILLGVVGDGGAVNNPGYFEAYASFVGGVAALGADGIEIWNEPNIDREWASGSIDPGRYTEMLRLSYNAIKGANPNTLVVSGAPAPTGFFGGCSGGGCDDNFFVQGMAAAGAANYMDCIGIHYNEGIVPPTATSGDPRGNSGHYTRYYQTMVNTYYNAFGGARQLCFTELGYLTPEGFGPLPPGFQWAENVTVGQQAGWLDQVVSMAGGSGRVRLLIIWNVDFTNYGADPMAGYAMIRPGGDCPACRALGQ